MIFIICWRSSMLWEKLFRKYLESAYMVNLDIFQREVTKDAEEQYRALLEQTSISCCIYPIKYWRPI
ncbi:MAG: hypothetical protein AAGC65_01885 [Mucilaginibacter sp.]|uniref:hypothetical protein n=1 Tax=Mucilaginibacter sp. TaxID=1882438 RepID=UPI0031A13112